MFGNLRVLRGIRPRLLRPQVCTARASRASLACVPRGFSTSSTDRPFSVPLALVAVLAGTLASIGWASPALSAGDNSPKRRYSLEDAKEILRSRLKAVRASLRDKRNISSPPPVFITEEPNGLIKLQFETNRPVDTHDLLIAVNNALRASKKEGAEEAPVLELHSATTTPRTLSFVYKDKTGSFLIARKQSGGTAYTFYRDDYVTDHEIEALLAAYEAALSRARPQQEILIQGPMGSFGNANSVRGGDPRSRLEQLGVRVYDSESVPQGEGLDWDALAGYEDVKQTIEDTIILALKHPDKYDEIARKTRKRFETNRPKAILFEGPPGTGKTLSARIIASKAGIPMVHISVEKVLSKWYSESEKNVSAIFDACDEMGGAMIFIDEVDAFVKSRDTDQHEVTGRVLSVLLQKLDGFSSKRKSVLVCATNRKEDLDPALLSRFNLSLNPEELKTLAKRTAGFSARDLKEVCEDTERRWASKLIRNIVKQELPSLSEYEASVDQQARGKNLHPSPVDQI